MGPPGGVQNDWERWRGKTDATSDDHGDDIKNLWLARNIDLATTAALHKEIVELKTAAVELKTKLSGIVALASFIGSIAGVLGTWALSKL